MEIKYSDAAAQTLRMKSQMAEALAAKSSQADRQVQLSARQVRRLRARQAAREQKKATRRYVRRQWVADREEQNLLGLARVDFRLVEATPAMQENVEAHLAAIEIELAGVTDEMTEEEMVNAEHGAARKVNDRLHHVLKKAHTEAIATAEDMTYADTRGRTFVSVVKG